MLAFFLEVLPQGRKTLEKFEEGLVILDFLAVGAK